MSWNKIRIQELRRRLELTQTELALQLGCRQQTISEWEQGLYEPANAYGRLLDQLERQLALSGDFKRTEPKAQPTSHQMEVISEFSFDKPFDPAID